MIVHLCKRGSFTGKYITLVECWSKCLLILVNRDDAVKLSEWEADKNEVDPQSLPFR